MAFWSNDKAAIDSARQQIAALQVGIVDLIDAEQANRQRIASIHPWQAPDQTQETLIRSWLAFGLSWTAKEMFEAAEATGALTGAAANLTMSVAQLAGNAQTANLPMSLYFGGPISETTDVKEALRKLASELWEQAAYAWSQANNASLPREMRPWRDAVGATFEPLQVKIERLRLEPASSIDCASTIKLANECLLRGQQAIKPSLFNPSYKLRGTASAPSAPAPSQTTTILTTMRSFLAGADPWLVTAPEMRAPSDLERVRQLDKYWLGVYNPDNRRSAQEFKALLGLISQLEKLVSSGQVVRQVQNGTQICMRSCPWVAVYEATSTINLGERIGKGTIFAVYPHNVAGRIEHVHRLGAPVSSVNDNEEYWKATDANQRQALRSNPSQYTAAVRQLAAFWRQDDNPRTTQALLGDLAKAISSGRVSRCPSGAIVQQLPWPSVYVVGAKRVVVGEGIMPQTRFALVFCIENGKFCRKILRIAN